MDTHRIPPILFLQLLFISAISAAKLDGIVEVLTVILLSFYLFSDSGRLILIIFSCLLGGGSVNTSILEISSALFLLFASFHYSRKSFTTKAHSLNIIIFFPFMLGSYAIIRMFGNETSLQLSEFSYVFPYILPLLGILFIRSNLQKLPIRHLFIIVSWFLTVSSLHGIYYWTTRRGLISEVFFIQPIAKGGDALIFLIFSLTLLRNWRFQNSALFLNVLAFFAIIVSGSRTNWILGVLIAVVFFIGNRSDFEFKKLWKIFTILSGSLILFFSTVGSFALFATRWSSLITLSKRNSVLDLSERQRNFASQKALEVWGEHFWFGAGTNFKFEFASNDLSYRVVESNIDSPYSILAKLGVFGFFLSIATIFTLLAFMWQHSNLSGNRISLFNYSLVILATTLLLGPVITSRGFVPSWICMGFLFLRMSQNKDKSMT